MKKVIFLFAMVFVVTFAMAQNTAVVNQTGNSHDASVAQTGDLNGATVDQFGGNNNYIDVVSTGNRNVVDVDQNGTDINAANVGLYGYVHQTGNENNAKLDQEGSKIDGKIDQINGFNTAVVTQTGTWLQLESHGLVQERAYGDAGNEAYLTQTNSYQSLNASQYGSANILRSNQSGNKNQFSAFQDGISNYAEITQSGSDNFAGWESTTNNKLTQTGTDNDAFVTQLGGSLFLLTQLGDFNYTGMQLTRSVAKVLQDGDNNYVGGMVDCTPTTTAILVDASLDAQQLGNWNKLYVSTAGNLTIVQDNTAAGAGATGNTIMYTQTGAGTVALTQAGDANLIWLKNTSTTVPMDVDVYQEGNGNAVASFENGVATDCARFAGKHLDIDQLGNDNSLHLNSAGALDIVNVMQNGSNNWASVIQSSN